MPVFDTPLPLQIPSRTARIVGVTVDAMWWLNDETDIYNTHSVTAHEHDHVLQKTFGLDVADTVKMISNNLFTCGSFPLPETRVLAERAENICCRVDIEIDSENFPDAIVFEIQHSGDNAPLTATFHTHNDIPEDLNRFGEIVVGFLASEHVTRTG